MLQQFPSLAFHKGLERHRHLTSNARSFNEDDSNQFSIEKKKKHRNSFDQSTKMHALENINEDFCEDQTYKLTSDEIYKTVYSRTGDGMSLS